MKKILIVSTEFPPYPGGIGTYAYNIANYANENNDVKVITASYGEEDKKEYSFDIDYYKGGVFKKSDLFILIFKILKHRLRVKYDIIHAVDWPSVIALDIINIFIRTPYITTLHGTEIFIYKKFQKKILLKNILLKYCQEFFTNSSFTKELAINNLEIDSSKVIRNYLGVSNDFTLNSSDVEIFSKYHIDKSKKIILSVSRIESRKGYLDAIDALSLLDSELKKDIIYIIIGKEVDSEYTVSVKEKLKSTQLEYKILSSLPFSDLLSFYKNSYLFLLPGKEHHESVEGFGLVYIEASSQGLPSLAYNLSAVPEVVKNDINGFTVEKGNVLALKNKIELLISNRELYGKLRKTAIPFSHTFSWQTHIDLLYKDEALA